MKPHAQARGDYPPHPRKNLLLDTNPRRFQYSTDSPAHNTTIYHENSNSTFTKL
jgi:hypothetical protein